MRYFSPQEAIALSRSRYLPTVLTQDEAIAVIGKLSRVYQRVVKLLYGSGLRLLEALRLRVKDLDFAQGQQQPPERDRLPLIYSLRS
jgi:integrase